MTVNPPSLNARRNWRDDALCRTNPDLFFPVGRSAPALVQAEEAKAVCRRCPAMATCLRWAIGTRQENGVSGGMDEREKRAAIRKVRQGEVRLEDVADLVKWPEPPRVPVVRQLLERREELAALLEEGKTHRAIAARIGVPGASKATVKHAAQKLRQEKTVEAADAVAVAA